MIKTIKLGIMVNNRDEIIEQAKQAVYFLINYSKAAKDKIIGIGIAMQGAVDVERGISVFSPYFARME